MNRIAGRAARMAVRWCASRSFTRPALNAAWVLLPPGAAGFFHSKFCALFRQYEGVFDEGDWLARFGGKTLRFPLRKPELAIDWDTALSATAHDPELKQTYLRLARHRGKPELVLDVGANFGAHTILFLSLGAEVVAFEPNPRCAPYLRELVAHNGFSCRLEQAAVTAEEGRVELSFPVNEEWFGTTDPAMKARLAREYPLTHIEVPQVTLDEYVRRQALRPDWIKIDTEGGEASVLRGASFTLDHVRPVVFFESWPGSGRDPLVHLFTRHGYRIASLPLARNGEFEWLSPEELRLHRANNYLAIPR